MKRPPTVPRMKAAKPIAGDHNIPASFWEDVTPEEIHEICENNSCLTSRLKERLYRMLDIQNPPLNEEIQIMVNHDDLVQCMWDEWKAHPEKFKKKPSKPRRWRIFI